MKCPNCDFIDKDEAFGDPATCPKCGAIYEKALRVQQLKKKLEMQKASSAARQTGESKTKSWIVKGLKGAADEVKSSRAKRSNEEDQTLYTKDGTPVLIRTDKKGGGCLKPMVILASVILLVALFSASKTSYKGYAERASNSNPAIEQGRLAAEKRKSSDDDMRRIKMQRMAREGIMPKLHDPDAAKFRNQRGACGEVNAKNLFGAYTGYKRFMYGGPSMIFIENDPKLADGAFEDAWEQLCKEGGKLTF